jgi:prepilin-type N-terminal cleavage/methylation domain-containing protein/prepilin-type processing-associated H-X9-DG protein
MPRRPAFTLIELLVTISIVALLIAITLPVLGSAREAARAAKCLSNLRQMGIALQGYVTTEGGYFPLYARADAPGWTAYWFGRGQGSGVPAGQRRLERDRGALSPYLGRGVTDGLLCPAFPYDHAKHTQKFTEKACSYGLNINLAPYEYLAASRPGIPVRADAIARPSAVMTFADGVQHWAAEDGFNESFYIGIDELSYLAHADPLDDPNGGFAHFRHAGATQLAYLDGHAAADRFDHVRRTHADLGGSPAGHLTPGPNGPDTPYGRTW